MNSLAKFAFIKTVLLLGSLLALSSCQPPQPEYVLPLRRVQPLVTTPEVREVTRVVARVITATPPSVYAEPSVAPFTMYLAPADEGDEETSALAGQLQEWLIARMGREVRVVVPHSYRESIDGLCRGEADVAWLATPAYLLAAEECGSEATMAVVRNDLAFYRGQWLVQSDAWRAEQGLEPLRSLADLAGQAVAYTEVSSPTGYLFPRAMLAQRDIRPEEEVLVGGDSQAVLAVYRGEVDAAATFWAPVTETGQVGDARALLSSVPGIAAYIKILTLTDPIPTDPVVFRRNMDGSTRETAVVALVDLARSPDGRALLTDLYGISGLVPVADSDYDLVREMTQALGISAEDLLNGEVEAAPLVTPTEP